MKMVLSPVMCAQPSMLGMMASRLPTVAGASMRPWNRLPMMLSWSKLTVRLGREKFQKIYDMAESADRTYQSILEAAITDFLEKQD
jgi:hypothetical protein